MAKSKERVTLMGSLLLCILMILAPFSVRAAPYAAVVIDARNGKVLHSRNADTRLHPASLTKMMTLYVAFQALEHGEISLDSVVRIPAQAAAEPPSKLGLKAGQKIKFRYLIRAAAIKSANDAATAIGFAIEGSEAAFARRMTRTAKAMGMTRTTFKNAHGLTESGHLSTARDMTVLGRHLIYDYPQYYNLFSRRTADAGLRTVPNTNRRFLNAYKGADGIKTGYTRAAGFNLVASAERGRERVIVTMFGGTSSAQRNARVAELMDMGFARAKSSVRLRKPGKPAYRGSSRSVMAGAVTTVADPQKAGAVRVAGAPRTSLRPRSRPDAVAPVAVAAVEAAVSRATINFAVEEAVKVAGLAAAAPLSPGITPPSRPASLVASPSPKPQEVVARVSTSSGRHWGINVGRYNSRYQAERVLVKVALNEMESLDGALRKVSSSARGHDANFLGLSRDQADIACRRLNARGTSCFMISP